MERILPFLQLRRMTKAAGRGGKIARERMVGFGGFALRGDRQSSVVVLSGGGRQRPESHDSPQRAGAAFSDARALKFFRDPLTPIRKHDPVALLA